MRGVVSRVMVHSDMRREYRQEQEVADAQYASNAVFSPPLPSPTTPTTGDLPSDECRGAGAGIWGVRREAAG